MGGGKGREAGGGNGGESREEGRREGGAGVRREGGIREIRGRRKKGKEWEEGGAKGTRAKEGGAKGKLLPGQVNNRSEKYGTQSTGKYCRGDP